METLTLIICLIMFIGYMDTKIKMNEIKTKLKAREVLKRETEKEIIQKLENLISKL